MTDTKNKISFVKDPQTNTYILTGPDGKTLTHIERGAPKPTGHSLPSGEYVSPARILLERLQSGRDPEPRIQRVEINGGAWYIRKLRSAEVTKIGLLSSRDKDGKLDLLNTESLESFTVACLLVGVAANEEDTEDFFGSAAEVYALSELMDDDITHTIGKLFEHVVGRNRKSLLPDLPDNEDDPKETEKKSVSESTGEGESVTSSMPPTTPESSSSTPAASTAAP